jgi:hypothetical protein
VQAGFLGLLREFQVGELQPVGGHLQVREAHVVGHPQHIEESRIDGRLASRELHDAPRHRLFIAQRLQHAADLLEMRLIHVTRRIGVGETYRTRQIATVCEVYVGQTSMAGMHVAQAAIVRAARGGGHRRIRQALAVAESPLLHLQVQARVGEHNVAEFAMLGTRLLHDHAAVFLEDPRR